MPKNSPERFNRFVVTSLGLHAGLVVFAVLGPSLFPARTSMMWGSDTGRGGNIKVGVVASLPGIELPSPPVVDPNAAASDATSLHASEPEPKARPNVEPTPEVLIPSKDAKNRQAPGPLQRASKVAPPEPPNAVPGAGGQVAAPYGQSSPGAGPATFGDEAFGQRYGAYVQAMTNAIREKWQEGISGIGRAASPRVYVTFTIQKDGKVSNVQIAQASGNSLLDNSALRAVVTARIAALPRDYAGASVDVRFYFEYVR